MLLFGVRRAFPCHSRERKTLEMALVRLDGSCGGALILMLGGCDRRHGPFASLACDPNAAAVTRRSSFVKIGRR